LRLPAVCARCCRRYERRRAAAGFSLSATRRYAEQRQPPADRWFSRAARYDGVAQQRCRDDLPARRVTNADVTAATFAVPLFAAPMRHGFSFSLIMADITLSLMPLAITAVFHGLISFAMLTPLLLRAMPPRRAIL